QMTSEDRPDTEDRLQRLTAAVDTREPAQLAFDELELLLERGHHRDDHVNVRACARIEIERTDPALALTGQQPAPRARPALVGKQPLQPLRPPSAVTGEPLAQPRPVTQPLDLLRRQPRLTLREQIAGEHQRQPACVKPVGLRAPATTLQRACPA